MGKWEVDGGGEDGEEGRGKERRGGKGEDLEKTGVDRMDWRGLGDSRFGGWWLCL